MEAHWYAPWTGHFISDKYRLLKRHQSAVTKIFDKKPISIELQQQFPVGASLLAMRPYQSPFF
jgi:hypothetical protein